MSPDALCSGVIGNAGDLPAGWTLARLSKVAEIIAGQSPPSETYNQTRVGLPFFQGKAEFGSLSPTPRKWCDRPSKIAEAGDVLISVRAPVGPTNVATERCGIGRGLAAIRPGNATFADWLLHYLRFSERRIAEKGTGTTFSAITAPVLAALDIPLAPLPEQRRIVARIGELFAEIDEGEAALERARQGLDTWRRALLKAAVTGELTRDWREVNRPAETGADLLARIRAERGASNGDYPRRGRASAPGQLDISTLSKLPEGWVWARLGDLGVIVGGVTVDKKRMPADPIEVPYLRVANVQRGSLDLSEVKTICVERSIANRLELRTNDILLNEGGDRDKIGRGWVWQGELPVCIHQNHIFRVRPHDGINPFFVSHSANEIGRAFFIEKGKQTTNLASISLSKISELPVPVPPAVEAKIIVDRLRDALDIGADNHRDISEATELSSAIRQSILKAAFESRLVPHDPTDEPASVLLVRLRHGDPQIVTRRRRAIAKEPFSHPSLPGLTRQSLDPQVEPAGDE
jgi:type I restriction enzyme S subunit